MRCWDDRNQQLYQQLSFYEPSPCSILTLSLQGYPLRAPTYYHFYLYRRHYQVLQYASSTGSSSNVDDCSCHVRCTAAFGPDLNQRQRCQLSSPELQPLCSRHRVSPATSRGLFSRCNSQQNRLWRDIAKRLSQSRRSERFRWNRQSLLVLCKPSIWRSHNVELGLEVSLLHLYFRQENYLENCSDRHWIHLILCHHRQR